MENSGVENKSNNSVVFWGIILTVCVLFIVIIFVGFNVNSKVDKKVIMKEENGGDIELKYVGSTNGLTLMGGSPIKEEIGKKLDRENLFFDFSVEVQLDNAKEIEYEISINKDKSFSNVNDEDIRIYLEEEQNGSFVSILEPVKFTPLKEDSKLGTESGNMVLHTTKRIKSGVTNYRLRIWIDEKCPLTIGNYSVEVSVNGKAK